MDIVIEAIDYNDVVLQDKKRYNSNNHWINDQMPDDYLDAIERGNTSRWIDNYKKYIKIVIPSKHLHWLKKANEIGMRTGKFSEIYREELDQLLSDMSETDIYFKEKKYFVRTDHVSLKFGQHGVGPYTNLKNIIESSVSCLRGHSPFNQLMTSLNIYLIDWVDMNSDLEFRMFVYNGNVTCISQQKCYSSNETIKHYSETHIEAMINKLVDYYQTSIKGVFEHTSYSIDISLVNGEPYFIEINCFGSEYAAGSSLFHWIIDHDLLYSDGSKVHFRYTF